jgi:hypothetical protein
MAGLPETQKKPGDPTTAIRNTDGEMVPWDAIREACNVPPNRKQDPSFLTAHEASRKWKISPQAIYARAKREKWRLLAYHEKNAIIKNQERDWKKSGEKHREQAFRLGHESLKKFKPRAPKDFKELDIADRIARRAAGLENDSIVQQTLVHINEAVEGHAEEQVLEASVVDNTPPLDLEDASIDESSHGNQDTVSEVS